MEEINFINAQDLKKNNKLKKYVKLSILLTILIFIILVTLTIMQKNKLYAIQENIKKNEIKIKSTSGPGEPLEQKTKLKNEKIELKKQLQEINDLKKTPKKEASILLNIYKIIAKQVDLQTISVNKNDFVVLAESPDDKIANKITKRLSKLQYIKTANLTSMQKNMQKNDNKFVFQIKGEIKA